VLRPLINSAKGAIAVLNSHQDAFQKAAKPRKIVVFVTFLPPLFFIFVTLIAFGKKLPFGTWFFFEGGVLLNVRHTSLFLLYVGV
jgi:hypothetical protein